MNKSGSYKFYEIKSTSVLLNIIQAKLNSDRNNRLQWRKI